MTPAALVAAWLAVVGPGCLHGEAEVEEVCKSSTVQFEPGAGLVTTLSAKAPGPGADSEPLLSTPSVVEDSTTVDFGSIVREFDVELVPLRLSLKALSGVQDLRFLQRVVITIAPSNQAPLTSPALPESVVTDKTLGPEEASLPEVRLPLQISGEAFMRYVREGRARMTVRLTGTLPPQPFAAGAAVCFQARGRF